MQFLFLFGLQVVVCFLGARLGYSFCHDLFSHYGSFPCRYGAFRIFDGPEYTPSFLSTYSIFLDARLSLSYFISLLYSRPSFRDL